MFCERPQQNWGCHPSASPQNVTCERYHIRMHILSLDSKQHQTQDPPGASDNLLSLKFFIGSVRRGLPGGGHQLTDRVVSTTLNTEFYRIKRIHTKCVQPGWFKEALKTRRGDLREKPLTNSFPVRTISRGFWHRISDVAVPVAHCRVPQAISTLRVRLHQNPRCARQSSHPSQTHRGYNPRANVLYMPTLTASSVQMSYCRG